MIHYPSDNTTWLSQTNIDTTAQLSWRPLIWQTCNGTVQHTFNTFSTFGIRESATNNRCPWNNIFSQRSWESCILNSHPPVKECRRSFRTEAIFTNCNDFKFLSRTSRISRTAKFWQVDGWSRWTCQQTPVIPIFFVDFIEICILITRKLDHCFSFLGIFKRLFHHRKACRCLWCLVIVWNC